MGIFGMFLLPVDDSPPLLPPSFSLPSLPLLILNQSCYVAQGSLGLTIVVQPGLAPAFLLQRP